MKQAGAAYHVVELDIKSDEPSGADIQGALGTKTGRCLLPCIRGRIEYPPNTPSMKGRTTVPNVFINKVSVGGGTEVRALFQSGKLTEMLKEAGVLA